MQQIRRSNERGFADLGWLKSFHSFSFGDYFDRDHIEFGPLRVINEDRVQPGEGFGKHPHRDMEIITYVLEGELAHQDSLGNGSIIRPGDVQRMSAGTGVWHSEFNPSSDRVVHFLQIWIQPDAEGVKPSYEQRYFAPEEKRGRLRLIASPEGSEGSVLIHQDARVYAALLDGAEHATLTVDSGRNLYIHVVRGSLEGNGTPLQAGDALKLMNERTVKLSGARDAEVLVFDLPAA